MSKPFPDSQLKAIVSAVEKHSGGATLLDVAFALTPPPPLRNVQRWLSALVRQKRLVRKGSNRGTRYEIPGASTEKPATILSRDGAAIQQLVNQPIDVRAAADYRRISLESYSPNRTSYVPADIRARLAAPIAGGNGTAAPQSWREPAMLQNILADLAWRSGWLESQWTDNTLPPLSLQDVAAWLTQPESLNARPDVQLVWNQRSAFFLLVNRGPDVAVTRDWFVALYGALTNRMTTNALLATPVPGLGRAEAPEFFRRQVTPLARTSYFLPNGPWIIETCFNEILGWSAVITDPVERAFFVFVHVLYLQPFGILNASMACLAVNIPLLAAGLPPITFAGVRGADLLDGLRGVWELNRTELLRDVFVAAYDDCRARYAR